MKWLTIQILEITIFFIWSEIQSYIYPNRIDNVQQTVARHHVWYENNSLISSQYGVALSFDGDDAFISNARYIND